jgi:beta-fructofuranosidase
VTTASGGCITPPIIPPPTDEDLDRFKAAFVAAQATGQPTVLPPDPMQVLIRESATAYGQAFVYRDPDGDWRMLMTARIAGGRRNDDGVLAAARSSDMRRWEVLPPVTAAGTGFGQMEVPQIGVVNGQPVLVFTCHPDEQTDEQRRRFGEFCTWSVLGPSSTGPWDIAAARPFMAEPKLFAAPLVRDRAGQWVLLGFRNQEADGIHSFDLIDPIPVEVRDGALGPSRMTRRLS